jgi:capsule polysaccharide modification protein KpsS
MIDRSGYSGWAESGSINVGDIKAISDNIAEKFYNDKCIPIIDNKVTKYTQSDASFEVDGEYVFCAMQILTDSVAKLAYINSLDMVINTVKALEGTKYKVVIKRHPFCKSSEVTSILEELSRSKNVIITEADIHKIIPNCKAVITVNSGVGLEALIMGKKVFTTGRAEYSPASIMLSETSSFIGLAKELEIDVDINFINKFLYLYFKKHLLDAYSSSISDLDKIINLNED